MSLQKNSDAEMFGSTPMLPLMLRMAFPSILAQLVNMLYSMVDRVYIGHIEGIGTKALAGVGVCNTMIILISAFAQFAGGGGAPLAAIELGRGNRDKAEKMMGNGCFLLLVLTVLLMVPVYLFLDPILYATGASAGTIVYARNYLSIYLGGTLAVMLTIGLNPFINAQGHPGTAMLSVLIGAALNIVLDPVFIFVFGMGVSGAGTCHGYFSDRQCVMDFVLSSFQEGEAAPSKEESAAGKGTGRQHCSAWCFAVCHGEHGEHHRACHEPWTCGLWRHLCQCADDYAELHADFLGSTEWIYAGSQSGHKL